MKSTRMVSVLAAKSKSAPVTCHGGETPKAASNSLSVIPDPVPAQVQLTHSKLKRGSKEDDELNTRQTPAQRKAARRLSLLRSPRERSDKCRPQQQVSRTVLSTECLSLLSTLRADTYRRSARTSTLQT